MMLNKLIPAFAVFAIASLLVPLGVFAQSGGSPTDKFVEVFRKTKSDVESKTIEPSQKESIDLAAIRTWGEEVQAIQSRRVVPYGSANPSDISR